MKSMPVPPAGNHEQSAAASAPRTVPVPWALAGLSMAMLLSSLGTSIANVGLPELARAFDAPFQQVQWVVLAYLLAITTLVVSVGRLGDLVGRRRLMLGGIVLFTAASVLCGAAPALWLLVAARAVQGLGAAIMMALGMAMVGEAVPKERTGSAMGLLGTMSAIGTALGPTLGGVLIATSGWPALFLVNVPLGLLTLVVVYRTLPVDGRAPHPQRVAFDHWGSLWLALTLAAYALAMTLGRGGFGAVNLALLLLAAAGAGVFVRTETRAASPLVRLALFRGSALGAGFAMSALATTVVMATLVVGPFYLSGALALDAARVGLAMSCGPIVAALAGVPAGRLVDRFGAPRMVFVGLAAMALGASSLALLPTRLGLPAYVVPLVVTTAGYALFQAANNTAVMAGVQAQQRGVVSGLLNLSRNLGLITGASAMGAVFAAASATSAVVAARPEAVATGMRVTFGVAAVLVLLALGVAWSALVASRRAPGSRAGAGPARSPD